MKTQLLAFALFAGLFASSEALPVPTPLPNYHAFCRALWLFASPCAKISTGLMHQIQDLCHFNLVSATPSAIKANHTSYDGLQAESIVFTFTPTILSGGCRVDASSTSMEFTPLLDGGRNFCNLYNVLSTSRLDSSPGFMEMISEWSCLDFGPATCED